MYTLFLLGSKSSWRNLGFSLENDVENVRWMRGKRPIQAHIACITMFSTSFSTVNPRFLQEYLLPCKKSVYRKNAEERAGFKIFWRKLWKWSLPCQNWQKPPQNDAIYLLCGFLRNWPTKNGASIWVFKRASLKSTYLREFFDLGSQIFVEHRRRLSPRALWTRLRQCKRAGLQLDSRGVSKLIENVTIHDMPSWSKSHMSLDLRLGLSTAL